MSRSLATCAVVAGTILLALQVQPLSGQSQGRGRGFGRAVAGANGRKAIPADMPQDVGARHGVDAVDALRGELGQKVRDRGGDPERYAEILRADESLWITSDGQAMFVDVIADDATEGSGDPALAEPASPTGPPPQPTRLLASGLPIHHSKPGAPWTIFLDFDGAVVRPGAGGIVTGTRSLQGLTIDADATGFNVDEQAVISRTWGRVAEDFAPFDVDVTTEEPALIGPRVLWSIVGRHPNEIGLGSNIGGVSGFCLCYMPFGISTPTFTFWGLWGATNHSDIADTITHEGGHMLGLLHDGVVTSAGFVNEYYSGHGAGPTSWAPVMGNGGRNVTQWSRGEYEGAVNPNDFGVRGLQEDIVIIGGKLGARADDVGDTIATAAPLALPTTGYITSTADVDVFALPRATDVRIEITPFRAGELTDGGNLDVAAEIVNEAGLVVASVDDLEETAATVTALLPSGQHYLRVKPSFNPVNYPAYGSLGQYTVTGTFTNVVRFTGFGAPLPAEVMTPGRTVPVKFALTDTVATARVQLWSEPSPLGATVLAETTCRAQAMLRQHCNLKLPKDLAPGTTYWIVAQYEDLGGQWITAQPASGSLTTNPLPFMAR